MTAAPQERDVRRRRLVRLLLVGAALTLPRFALAFFAGPATDALQIATVLLLVVGVAVAASAVLRLWLLRSRRVLPVAGAGIAVMLVTGLVVTARPAGTDQVAYEGGLLAPAPAVLFGVFYLALGALSQLGLFLVLGAVAAAISRWALRRAAR